MNKEKPKFEPNKKQKECIETINGPVMVLAGPGTGKTYTIIQRIKYMLTIGIQPQKILCLTYSDAAANEMKARLVKEIGIIAAAVSVNTYHAFCNEIIREYPSEFELLEGVSLVDEISARTIMGETIEEINPQVYRTKWGNATFFIPEHIESVKEIKSNQLTKEKYFNNIKNLPSWQKKMDELQDEYNTREAKGKLVKTFLNSYETQKRKIAKAIELWDIYEKYDINLKKNNFIDFADMINMVLDIFDKNEEFLKKVASQYEYFLVDEYQDTNYLQNKIVFKLAEGANSKNIFVVGDDDQIIYEFQGAKTDNLEKFLIHYPDTKVICLNENNRSTQNILDFSYKIISQDKSRLEFNPKFSQFNISKVLTAMNKDIIPLNSKIQIHGFADILQENNFIVEQIKKLINSDKLPLNKENEKDLSKIAILTRENSELLNFVTLLEAQNIKYQLKQNKSIFEIKSSLILYCYLKALVNNEFYADKLFVLLQSKPFEFDNADYTYLLEQNRYNHKDLITNIKLATEHKWANPEKVNNFINTFDKLKNLKSSLNLHDIIINVINETGLLNFFVENEINKSDNIYAIKKITDEAKSFMHLHKDCWLGDFLNYLDNAFENDIPIVINKEEYTQNAIQLITLHGSKGREFEFVFMPHLIAKKWEGKKVNSSTTLPIDKNEDNIDEEQARFSEQLRLLFVGVTRAKHSLIMTYPNSIDAKAQELTKYLAEVSNDKNLVDTFNHELEKDDYINEVAQTLTKQQFNYSEIFKDEIKARIQNFTISTSALNSYMNCPREFLFSNILKIPIFDVDSTDAHYGSAIHKTLKWSVEFAKEKNNYPDKNMVLDNFKLNLSKEKFENQNQRDEYEERGLKSLDKYYSHMVSIPPKIIFSTEYSFNYIPVDNYFIKGFIDRIDKNDNNSYEVFDYKTGNAKSKTQIADGKDYENYLNQLRFYKYALELENEDITVDRAGLIFVEEPDKNFYINLTEEDNKIIKDKINYVYEEINKLNFDPPKLQERNCKYCNYKHLCKINELE